MESELPALYPRLWRFCASITGSHVLAEDLAQATCLRALEKKDQFRTGTHFDRWVFTIARNIWLNELRAKAVRERGGIVQVEDSEISDPRPIADTNIFAGEVLRAVMELPEAQRAAAVLVYVEGFKYAEAAEVLDIPVGTVMSRLAAARKTLNSRFQDQPEAVSK